MEPPNSAVPQKTDLTGISLRDATELNEKGENLGRGLGGELRDFAQEFEGFMRKDAIPTPQADFGIGPLKYNLKFEADQGIAEKPLALLDELVTLGKLWGDRRIKFEATILCLLYGKEDPMTWLPAAQRIVIRSEIARYIEEFVNQHKLTELSQNGDRIAIDIIHKIASLPQYPNPAELFHLCELFPRNRGLSAWQLADPRINQKQNWDVVQRLLGQRRAENKREGAVARVMMKNTCGWYVMAVRVYLMFEKEIKAVGDDSERAARREETITLMEEALAAVKRGQAQQWSRLTRREWLMWTVMGMLRRKADKANRPSIRSHHRPYKKADVSEKSNDESGEGGLESDADWESDWASEEETNAELEKTGD